MTRRNAAGPAERHALRLLAPVGGHREWWIWNPAARVGHLRLSLTAAELAALPSPPHCVLSDAGATGPERARTRR